MPRALFQSFYQEGRCLPMNTCLPFQPTTPRAASPALVFPLPGLLPADRRLLLDPETHTAIVLTIEGSDAVPMVRSFSLPPSATRVFLTLLQAYPHYSSFQSLFRSLYPSSSAQDRQEPAWERALSVTPVRRALKALLPMLRSLGWQVVSLRGQGYVLARTQKASRAAQR